MANNKVVVERYGLIHYHAVCENCDFEAAIFADGLETPQQVRQAVRRHVRQTGHFVLIEGGTSSRYGAVTAMPR